MIVQSTILHYVQVSSRFTSDPSFSAILTVELELL